MRRKSDMISKRLPVILTISVGILLVYLLRKPSNPEQAIKAAAKGTKWEPMTNLLIAQAKHETGNFQSQLARKYKNLFGMGEPVFRDTTSQNKAINIFEGVNKADYSSYLDSAKDMIKWLDQWTLFPVTTSPETYVKQLQSKGYFTDSYTNYLNGLKSWV